jgi:hypothetical protein
MKIVFNMPSFLADMQPVMPLTLNNSLRFYFWIALKINIEIQFLKNFNPLVHLWDNILRFK